MVSLLILFLFATTAFSAFIPRTTIVKRDALGDEMEVDNAITTARSSLQALDVNDPNSATEFVDDMGDVASTTIKLASDFEGGSSSSGLAQVEANPKAFAGLVDNLVGLSQDIVKKQNAIRQSGSACLVEESTMSTINSVIIVGSTIVSNSDNELVSASNLQATLGNLTAAVFAIGCKN